MAYLDTAQGRVYYEHHTGEKVPVLLIHAWAMSVRVWDSTLSALQEAGHAVIAFDHRACGRSDKDFGDFSIEAIAGDAAALCDKLGLDQVVVNGWSLGGAVATQVRAGSSVFAVAFPVLLGALLWGGLALRDPRLRAILLPRG